MLLIWLVFWTGVLWIVPGPGNHRSKAARLVTYRRESEFALASALASGDRKIAPALARGGSESAFSHPATPATEYLPSYLEVSEPLSRTNPVPEPYPVGYQVSIDPDKDEVIKP